MAATDHPAKTKLIMIILALFMPVFLVLPFVFWGGSNDEITINKKMQVERLAAGRPTNHHRTATACT